MSSKLVTKADVSRFLAGAIMRSKGQICISLDSYFAKMLDSVKIDVTIGTRQASLRRLILSRSRAQVDIVKVQSEGRYCRDL